MLVESVERIYKDNGEIMFVIPIYLSFLILVV